jgi:hypothetical protein
MHQIHLLSRQKDNQHVAFDLTDTDTKLHSKDNAAARRRLRRRIIDTSRKPTTQPTKLAEECDLV